jgi:hypothetical protein
MAWRLHLSDRTIKRLDILAGTPTLLAAWTQANRFTCLDLQNGSQRDDRTIEMPVSEDRTLPAWAQFVDTLTASNGVTLPALRAPRTLILATVDAKYRLYQTFPTEGGSPEVFLDVDGKEAQLELDSAVFSALTMARASGLIAALDAEARLHIYRQHVRVGVFATGLQPDEEFRPTLAIADDGSTLALTDGHSIVLFDGEGVQRKRIDLHYRLGALTAAPDGKRFVVSDLDANVIRVYDADLLPTHQRFAVDLLAEAKKSQLFASSAMSSAALGPLAISSKGVLAFALAGTVCVTSLARMKANPKP